MVVEHIQKVPGFGLDACLDGSCSDDSRIVSGFVAGNNRFSVDTRRQLVLAPIRSHITGQLCTVQYPVFSVFGSFYYRK